MLPAVDELVSAGRSLDAVDLLVLANRRERAAVLDRRLVRVRHDAFREIEASQGVAVWPRRLPDPFPEADGVVEVAAAGLNSDLVGGTILHHGCILVRGLLPPSTIEQLIDDVDAAFEAYEKWVRRAEDGAVDDAIGLPWFEPFVLDRRYDTGRIAFSRMVRDHHRVLLADSPPALFDVLEAFAATGVQDIVADYLGERPALALNKFVFRRLPYKEQNLGWHQDAAAFRCPARTINCWTALSECGVDAPTLEVFPARVNSVLNDGRYGLDKQSVLNLNVGPPTVLEFGPGDALMFDDLLVHRTAMHPAMTGTRYSIEAWFAAPNGFPMQDGPMVF